MKKKTNKGLVVSLIIFILLSCALGGYIAYDKYFSKISDNKVTSVKKATSKKTSSKKNTKNIKADIILQAEGFAGSSDILIYLDNETLYEYHKEENKKETLAYNIKNIYKKDDIIYAISTEKQQSDNSEAVTYLYEKELTYSSDDTATILYEECLSPSGFAGSSSYVIFLKDETLYYTNLNEPSYNVEKIAIGVESISLDTEDIVAKINNNFVKYQDLNFMKYN